MTKSTLVSFAVVTLLSVGAFAQTTDGLDHTLVRCTQNSAATGPYRYNVRIVRTSARALVADLHKVDVRTNKGRSIFTSPVRSQVVSTNPRIVTFWNEGNTFILKVPAKYARGNSIIDYTGAGLMEAGGVNYYMNCFSVTSNE